MTLATLTGLEGVPHLSPASNSVDLSNKEKYPYFSRLVAANDETGEVGALTAMLRSFKWSKITVLHTDTEFATDWRNSFQELWTGDHGDWTGEIDYRYVSCMPQQPQF